MTADRYLLTGADITGMPGLDKTHFLNPQARRVNKSLGDLTGITGFGFHIIEVAAEDEASPAEDMRTDHQSARTVGP